ncbi:MAG TPA: hypothetical protein VEU07_16635 [Candidatus Acidoferrum sp.]|nr:hypothetical protein [Candidatus Acidoferrum sp.]
MAQVSHGGVGTRGTYESQNMSLPIFGACLAGLVVTVIVVFLLMGWLFGYYQASASRNQVQPSPLAESRPVPAGPLLQVTPQQDLRAMRTEEEARLRSFGWVDRPAGVVRIPIDRAITLLVERGLPATSGKAGRR